MRQAGGLCRARSGCGAAFCLVPQWSAKRECSKSVSVTASLGSTAVKGIATTERASGPLGTTGSQAQKKYHTATSGANPARPKLPGPHTQLYRGNLVPVPPRFAPFCPVLPRFAVCPVLPRSAPGYTSRAHPLQPRRAHRSTAVQSPASLPQHAQSMHPRLMVEKGTSLGFSTHPLRCANNFACLE